MRDDGRFVRSHVRLRAAWFLGMILVGPVAWTQPEQAESPFPKTRIGELVQRFLVVYGEGDGVAFEAFLEREGSAGVRAEATRKRLVAAYERIFAVTGSVRPVDVLRHDERALVLRARGKDGAWVRFSFTLDPAEGGKLSSFRVEPGSPPLEPIGEWASLQELVDRVRERHALPALAVAVAGLEGPIDVAVSGVRRVDGEARVSLDDRFHVGSITKSMTATLIGRLVERGKLSFERTLRELLPEFPMRAEYEAVTLGELLRHRAGIAPWTSVDARQFRHLASFEGDATAKRRAFLEEVLATEPVGTPGEDYLYSNAGYSLAAHIAETCAGMAWEELLRVEVFEPLGMRHAGFGWPVDHSPEQPAGHVRTGGKARVREMDGYALGPCLAPGGDVHASLAELARYGRSHLLGLKGRDDLLRAATVRALHEPLAIDDERGYAAGWMVRRTKRGEVHEHDGSAGTFYARLVIFVEEGLVLLLVTNEGSVENGAVLQQVAEAVRGKLGR